MKSYNVKLTRQDLVILNTALLDAKVREEMAYSQLSKEGKVCADSLIKDYTAMQVKLEEEFKKIDKKR